MEKVYTRVAEIKKHDHDYTLYIQSRLVFRNFLTQQHQTGWDVEAARVAGTCSVRCNRHVTTVNKKA